MKHFRQSVRFVWAFWLLLLGVWCYGADEPIIKLGNGRIGNAQFSPDQKYLAILGSLSVEILDAQTFEWVDALPGTVTSNLGAGNLNLAFSPDGQFMAVAPGKIWDMTEFNPIHTFPEYYDTFVFSHDGRFLVMGDGMRKPGGDITVCEVGKWEAVKRFPGPAELLKSLDISPDDRFLAAGFDGFRPPPNLDTGSLIIWDFESRKELHKRQPRSPVNVVEFNPDGIYLAYNSNLVRLTFLEVGTWSVWKELEGSMNYPAGIAFDPETGNVAYPPWSNNVEFRNLEGELIQTFHGHTDDVRSISIRPDGRAMATTSRDGSAKLWDMETGEEIWHRDYSSSIAALSFRDNTVLFSCTENTLNVRKWLVTIGGRETVLPAGSPTHSYISFHPTEPVIASSFSGTIQFWDMSEGKLMTQIGRKTSQLSFSSDGAYLASVNSASRIVTIINYENLRIISEFEVRGAFAAALGSDGLIAIRRQNFTELWDWKSKTLKWAVLGKRRKAAFSPNGEFLFANEAVWEIPQQQLRFWVGRVDALAFSPDSSVLATVPQDEETIDLWDIGNSEIMESLSGAQNVTTLAFSPDGKLLAGSGDDGIIMVWQIDNSPPTAIETRGESLATWGGVKRSSLLQNYPNPFNPDTWIPFVLHKAAPINIRVYDVAGNLVRTLGLGAKAAGAHLSKSQAAYWDGKNDEGETVGSGIYFLQMRIGDETFIRKALLLE